jgi:dipeptidyl aminopeptidase/acylaminoacyl peptidase
MQQRSRVWSRTVASWRLGRLLVVTAAAALIVSGAEASSEPSPGRVIAFLRESGARPASTETARSVAVMEVAVETGVDRMVRRIHLTKHSWSPNGRRLAFIDSSSLFVLDLDSGRSRRVFRQAKPWPRMSSAATLGWSPDGRRLVVAGSLRGKRGLVLVDAVGKTPARLLVAAPAPRPIVGWSPDGREIAYGFTIRRPNPDQEDGRVGMAVVDTARADRRGRSSPRR